MSGNATIWYQPVGADDVVEIDLGRPWSTLEDYDVRDESISVAFSGSRTRVVFTATRNVDAVAELLDGTDYDVIRQLEGLMSHLRRGGLCSISENNRTLAAYLETFPDPRSTRINWLTNLFADYGNYTALKRDILVLQGPSPKMLWEEIEVDSGSTDYVLGTAPPVNDWSREDWILVRNKGFWPVLRLRDGADDAGLIQHGNRISFRLDLPLEVPPNAFEALSSTPDDPFVLTDAPGLSLDVRVHPGLGHDPVAEGTVIVGPSRWW